MSAQIVTVKYNEDNVPYIGVGEHEIRLESEPPNETVLEKARTELRELPEIMGPAIAELREMLKGKQMPSCHFFFGRWALLFVTIVANPENQFPSSLSAKWSLCRH